jgi:putative tricarboxylic transport membrane protein
MKTWPAARVGSVIFGLCLAALGLFIGVETTQMSAGPEYAAVGPRAFPWIIGGGLVLVGAVLLLGAIRGAQAESDDEHYDWSAVAWIAGVLMAELVLLKWVGWVPAAALLFVGVAHAFGSRRWARDALIGLVFAGAAFVLFTQVLGLDLPAGEWLTALRSD